MRHLRPKRGGGWSVREQTMWTELIAWLWPLSSSALHAPDGGLGAGKVLMLWARPAPGRAVRWRGRGEEGKILAINPLLVALAMFRNHEINSSGWSFICFHFLFRNNIRSKNKNGRHRPPGWLWRLCWPRVWKVCVGGERSRALVRCSGGGRGSGRTLRGNPSGPSRLL